MKIQYDFDETEILQKATEQGGNWNDLKESIVREVKSNIAKTVVSMLTEGKFDSMRFNDKEYFESTVRDEILKRIEKAVETMIDTRLNNYELENKVQRYIERKVEATIEEKIVGILEGIKNNIMVVNAKDQEEFHD